MFKRIRLSYKELRETFVAIETHARTAAYSLSRDEYRTLLESERYGDPRRLNRFGYCAYSQADEDGIIEEIFNRIGVTTKRFVEFGCSDGIESNGHALLLKGWCGLWIDGDAKAVERIMSRFGDLIASNHLTVRQAFLTVENINELLSNYSPPNIDLLSVDIDGNDFHLLARIDGLKPRVVVAEYNARKGPTIDWVMQYNPAHVWNSRGDYYGVSLKALEFLMRTKGYALVGCSISGVNAFFVRDDLVSEDIFYPPFTAENHFEPQRTSLRVGIHTAHPRSYGPWTTSVNLLPPKN